MNCPFPGWLSSILGLFNVQEATDSHLSIQVVVTNYVGSLTSSPVSLEVTSSPQVHYRLALQHKAALVGTASSFMVTSFRRSAAVSPWHLSGSELQGKDEPDAEFQRRPQLSRMKAITPWSLTNFLWGGRRFTRPGSGSCLPQQSKATGGSTNQAGRISALLLLDSRPTMYHAELSAGIGISRFRFPRPRATSCRGFKTYPAMLSVGIL